MINICELALAQMKPEDIDHHESDLYLRVNNISKNLVAKYDFKSNVEVFIDQIDHVPWYDIPFAWTGDSK